MGAGGAVFHHCRIVHSSGPNRSARVRRAYANEWQLQPVPRATPASRPWIDAGKRAWERRGEVKPPAPNEVAAFYAARIESLAGGPRNLAGGVDPLVRGTSDRAARQRYGVFFVQRDAGLVKRDSSD